MGNISFRSQLARLQENAMGRLGMMFPIRSLLHLPSAIHKSSVRPIYASLVSTILIVDTAVLVNSATV